ncbi:hypothetical protein XACa0040 (plasmid) [Xanthomonas citri pv. citri str. 306]|uniref:Uncharacterized protein n=1 Tax=Xanthomonas axonopodis pv. citri (strain 306) TaxID=190486 RepID=A0AAI7ZJ97_XANAC|nr:hypothetical protein XACa0040 [Xanthomonas citri pv. citri str. 306]
MDEIRPCELLLHVCRLNPRLATDQGASGARRPQSRPDRALELTVGSDPARFLAAKTQRRFYCFLYFCKSSSRTSSAILVPRCAQAVLICRCRLSGTSMVRRFICSGSSLLLRLSTHASAATGAGLLVGLVPIWTFFVLIVRTPSVRP